MEDSCAIIFDSESEALLLGEGEVNMSLEGLLLEGFEVAVARVAEDVAVLEKLGKVQAC